MKLALRILGVNLIAGLVGAMAFSTHIWINFGFDIPSDFFLTCLLGVFVSLVASVVLVPLFLALQRLTPIRIYGGLVLAASILASMLYATWVLTHWKRFDFDLPELVGRAWNVYLYFAAFGVAYGISWIVLVEMPGTSRSGPGAASA